MPKFVSKYATVNAVLFDPTNEYMLDELAEFTNNDDTHILRITDDGAVMVTTNNGEVELLPDHWLIEGVSDFYPCDPVTFAARWQQSTPVVAEYRANPDARANAIQYNGDNVEAIQEFGGDKIEVNEDGIVWVNTNAGSQILDRTMWLVDGPTGLFVSDPVGFMIRWLPNE